MNRVRRHRLLALMVTVALVALPAKSTDWCGSLAGWPTGDWMTPLA